MTDHNPDFWAEVYAHNMKAGKSPEECTRIADEAAGPKPLAEPQKPEPDAKYFRTRQGVYAKVTGVNTFLKSYWLKGQHDMAENTLTSLTCEQLFDRKEWKPTTKNQWDKHLEPLSHAGTGTRSQKQIEFVFECDGVRYFKYRDELQMPEGRRREMEAVYLEYSAQADREYLQEIPKTILACIDHNPIKISEIAQICRDMIQRLEMTFDFGLFEKLASVIYFDMDEDTSVWDPAYNNRKIKRWRERGGMDFFLSMPISEYLPKGLLSKPDSITYLERERIKAALLQSRLSEVFKRLSTEQSANSSGKQK